MFTWLFTNKLKYKYTSPKSITIIGGGISGLSSAYYASISFPNTKIKLLESSNRVGGWIKSERIDLKDKGSALTEAGPRTLRPKGVGGALILDLIERLKLNDEVLIASKSSVAAKNRFLYHPDHLIKLPSSLIGLIPSIIKHESLRSIPSAIIKDLKTPSLIVDDESVEDLFTRRFGPNITKNIISAVVHGIYAADCRNLSVRSAFPSIYNLEQRSGSIIKGIFKGVGTDHSEKVLENSILDNISNELCKKMKDASVFSFKEGMEQLVNALENSLESNSNVSIYKNCPVKMIHKNSDYFEIETNHTDRILSDHVIAAISSKELAKCDSNLDLPILNAPDVAVVSLIYKKQDLPIQGFGYLIPRSTPNENNEHGALGVVIDSDAIPDQDPHQLTKLTVMLGGPYKLKSYVFDEIRKAAIDTVVKQLSPKLYSPIATTTNLAKACIPTYAPGHHKLLQRLHHSLDNTYKGQFSVTGSSYTGVSVGDCVRSGWEVIENLKKYGRSTGLERFINSND